MLCCLPRLKCLDVSSNNFDYTTLLRIIFFIRCLLIRRLNDSNTSISLITWSLLLFLPFNFFEGINPTILLEHSFNHYVMVGRLYDPVVVLVLNNRHPIAWFIVQVFLDLHSMPWSKFIHVFVFCLMLVQHRWCLVFTIIIIWASTNGEWPVLWIILRLLWLYWDLSDLFIRFIVEQSVNIFDIFLNKSVVQITVRLIYHILSFSLCLYSRLTIIIRATLHATATGTRYYFGNWDGTTLHLVLQFHDFLVSQQAFLAIFLFLFRPL